MRPNLGASIVGAIYPYHLINSRTGAFGLKKMAFEKWLQFVSVPRLKEIAENREELPPSSMLAPYAIREFDGDHKTNQLLELLYELDELINSIAAI